MKKLTLHTLIIVNILISINLISQIKVQPKLDNSKITVKLEEETKSNFETFYGYFIDLLTPGLALIGIILTIPILKRKLLENHISKALVDIQEANKQILLDTTELTDEFLPKTFTNEIVYEDELQALFEKLKFAYKESQKGNSDCQTMLFFLKHTLQNTIKHYNTSNNIFHTREIYGLVLYTLDLVNFFSTQVVQVPKSTKTHKGNLINKELEKYVTNSEFLRYKYFKQGLIDDPKSAHFLLFYTKINETSSWLLKRSAFQIFWDTSAIKKILYFSKIYAPLELKMLNEMPFFGGEYNTLYLIGFRKKMSLQLKSGEQLEIVDLIYSNPSDFGRFASNLEKKHLNEFFSDNFISDSGFNFNSLETLTHNGIETITLRFSAEYLENLYQLNKSKFKKKLK
ncbi:MULTISPECIES: hypothetical protein [Chryseobacterium]|uniref:hypothetical protein n=1 Tax=Chryseobacterium TaxID=59732 RepID=UPI0004930325|nr:hypothetical protein [Chryseobacterium hispalense]